MTVNEALKALQQLAKRGAGEVELRGADWDGNVGPVTAFEIDAGEPEVRVDVVVTVEPEGDR